MSIAKGTVSTEYIPAVVIAEKFDSYVHADAVDQHTVVPSSGIVIWHFNTQSLRDKTKQKQFASQLKARSVLIATCPESRFLRTGRQSDYG